MHTVLIIDDQQDLLDITRLFLERFGEMNVETAKSAKEALAKMKDRNFDALVVDFDLPDISGIEFLKIVRAKGDTTPIIIFTGVGRENAAIEALNNGADFFLKKGEDPARTVPQYGAYDKPGSGTAVHGQGDRHFRAAPCGNNLLFLRTGLCPGSRG